MFEFFHDPPKCDNGTIKYTPAFHDPQGRYQKSLIEMSAGCPLPTQSGHSRPSNKEHQLASLTFLIRLAQSIFYGDIMKQFKSYKTFLKILITGCLQSLFLFTNTHAQENEGRLQKGLFNAQATSVDTLGQELATSYSKFLKKDELFSWEVFVPSNYDFNSPPGVLVYHSRDNDPQLSKEWQALLEEKNLIWIATKNQHKSKASRHVKWNIIGVMSLQYLMKLYNIDTNRLYVSGQQEGGEVASVSARVYSEIFSGAIYINCKPELITDKVNKLSRPELIERMFEHRYSFVSDIKNKSAKAMRKVEERYNSVGIKDTQYLEIQNQYEEARIDVSILRRALDFIDAKE